MFKHFFFLVINMAYVWTEHDCALYLIRYMTKSKKKKSHIVTTSSAGYAAIPNSSNFKFTRLSI